MAKIANSLAGVCISASARTRFAGNYRVDESGCWIWTGDTLSSGYGRMHIVDRQSGWNKPIKAHRLSWLLAYGAPPVDKMVCHRCDVPLCVNPLHLFLGSGRENSLDSISKGRTPSKLASMRCSNGHRLTDLDLYIGRSPGRRTQMKCRICHRDWKRSYRARAALARLEATR